VTTTVPSPSRVAETDAETVAETLAEPFVSEAAAPTVRRVPLTRVAVIGAGLIVAIGIFLRFWTVSDLWLDEALTVNIAKLPLQQIPGALRHDGAPPLYYVLLHVWMLVFGQSDVAARALSGVVSVTALPFAWMAGRRLGGRRCAWATLLLVATSPFAINYATSTRMYSLVALWSLLGLLSLERAVERPTIGRLAALGVMTMLLVYTHYWGLYLVAVTGGWLFVRARRAVVTETRTAEEERRASMRCFAALAIGAMTFLPWLPTFAFQTLHTGTPWANAASPGDVLGVLSEYAGGGPWGAALALALFTLVLLGLFGRPIDNKRVLLELRTRRRARPIACLFIGTLGLAVIAGAIAGATFVGRYTSVVFPLFLLLAGLGATVFLDRKVMAGVLAFASVFGLIVAVGTNSTNRTMAGKVAAMINREANPGDLVVYCPDQLGPAVHRLVHVVGIQEATFPRGISPDFVDWVDYRQVIAETSVDQFGQEMVVRSGGHAIWYVWREGYPGTAHHCTQLLSLFRSLRPVNVDVVANISSGYLEHEALVRFAG
jgi:mannosyltransferase